MEFSTLLLWLHILTGTTGLSTGLLNLVLKKGTKQHRMMGNVFFYAMCLCSISAFSITLYHPNELLRFISMLTLYFAISGKLAIRIHSRQLYHKLNVISSGVLLSYAFVSLLISSDRAILYFFIAIAAFMFFLDLRNFQKDAPRIVLHLQKMCSACISSFTAFLVVNKWLQNLDIYPWILWTLPTIILTPWIIFWSRKMRSDRMETVR